MRVARRGTPRSAALHPASPGGQPSGWGDRSGGRTLSGACSTASPQPDTQQTLRKSCRISECLRMHHWVDGRRKIPPEHILDASCVPDLVLGILHVRTHLSNTDVGG